MERNKYTQYSLFWVPRIFFKIRFFFRFTWLNASELKFLKEVTKSRSVFGVLRHSNPILFTSFGCWFRKTQILYRKTFNEYFEALQQEYKYKRDNRVWIIYNNKFPDTKFKFYYFSMLILNVIYYATM